VVVIFIFFLKRALNLSDITSKTCFIANFLIVDLETIFNTEFLDMHMIYHYKKFHNFSNGSLVIAITPKSEKNM
jgi:hypothetical protein